MVEVVYQKGDGGKYKGRGDITKVTVASDVDEIAAHAFFGCSNLAEFNFGDSKVTKIGGNALYRTGITKIKFPDSVKEIGWGVLADCKDLKFVEGKVGNIEGCDFATCPNLETVVLKEGVTEVGERVVNGGINISTFVWPDSVKIVGSHVFQGCDKLHELAGSKDQEKVIENLKSVTPLMRQCSSDGKLEDIKKILDENSEAIKSCSPEGVKLLFEAHPAGLDSKDASNKVPSDYSSNLLEFQEGIIGDRSLGRDDALHESMMAAFRETNVKGLESAVEEFAKSPEIFDLFAWQQFLEIHHRNNPDPGYFVVEIQLLFEATWTVLTQANPKTDEVSRNLTGNLKAAIQKYVSDNNNDRPNLLPEFLTAVPMVKLQKLAATRIFRAHLDSYMRSGIMYIYYFEVFLYMVFTAIFTRLSVKFKSSKNGTYEWDDIVIRDMTIACFSLALYFLLRELAQFHAMYLLGLQRNWFKDFWNYIDLVASGGTIVLLEYYFRMGPGPEYEHFASVIALFVWMKVLGFAKAFSQPIATFVLMLSTIFRDLFSFMAVLVIILVMFGHAFYLLLSDNEASDGDEIVFTNIGGTAWSLYLMILGTFESSVFTGIWSQTLFLFFSFLVVIILLIVLIAIVSDSYDAVLVTSTELSYSETKKDVKAFFTFLYGFDSSSSSNKNNKLLLVARIIFSPLLVAFTTGFLILWWLPFSFVAFIFGKLYEEYEYQEYSHSWKDKLASMKNKISVVYGFKQDHSWSNKKNKLALLIRILFFPIILIISIPIFLLWYLPFYLYYTILLKTQGPRETSTEVDLDLKLDSSNSDWSGRVLDIVRRVNSVTSAEVNKIDAKMTAREGRMAGQIEQLQEENKLIMKMLSAVVKKVGADIEEKNIKDEGRPEDEESKQDDGKDDNPPESAKWSFVSEEVVKRKIQRIHHPLAAQHVKVPPDAKAQGGERAGKK
ncbi:hypothetical protein TrST_g3464 [Triparma strigata]|uniref:Ion transport domain-containing protein n=1 Tax=Triparma strigata TaxID=1606541 RepID=A0A9W7BUU3_9STRA|nr:hypothetical protein TrST_g3464 [Triparma strigata]